MTGDFGGHWTTQKLNALEEYLGSYTTALKRQNFRLVYIDAFAGRGGKPIDVIPLFDPLGDNEVTEFAKGSVRRALDLPSPFDRYLLIDSDSDACKILESVGPKFRAVAFLDPYACQLRFETIELLARTEAIDVWILFPTMAINRMLVGSGAVPPEWQPKLQSVFGVEDWSDAFYRDSTQYSMFDQALGKEKQITPERLEDYYGRRLSDVFAGGVVDTPLRLSNSAGSHLFALFFACANPSPKANGLAKRLARSAISNASSGIRG